MLMALLSGGCSFHRPNIEKSVTDNSKEDMTAQQSPDVNRKDDNMATIYFAGGCFWGTEHFMKQIDGVTDTEVGYANSNIPNPTYKEVCSGKTGAAETVKVTYNPKVTDLQYLITLYFATIDPTIKDRQGNDIGTQYRTGIYYSSEEQKKIIEETIDSLRQYFSKPIVTEVLPIKNFYNAEDYHQDYLDKNPNGYCHINPQLFRMAKEESLKRRLTPVQYNVTQQNGTEPPFKNEYWNEHRKGIYVDIVSGQPLFVSTDKFDSGCGWPAFSRPIDDSLIVEKKDTSHGMVRTEVRTKDSDIHLGHVFNDGPIETGGLRYCINSASLRFVPLDSMKSEGYADLIPLVK